MKIESFGLNIVSRKVGSVETLTLFQNGVFTLKCFFYDWGVKRIVPIYVEVDPISQLAIPEKTKPQIVSIIDYKNANLLSEKDKVKLMLDTSRRFLKRVDLDADYKFSFEFELSEEETKQLWSSTAVDETSLED